MSKIKLTLPENPITGKQVSFMAPCHSTDITGLVINGVDYALVDADGVSIAGLAYAWEENAMVSVLLNADNHTAFIQNASPKAYMEATVIDIKHGGTGATTKEGALANLGGAKIQSGSYKGKGTAGQSTPNSLTFDFIPKLVIIHSTEGSDDMICIQGCSQTDVHKGGSSYYTSKLTWNNKTLSWYTVSNDPYAQLNGQNTNYSYIAIG